MKIIFFKKKTVEQKKVELEYDIKDDPVKEVKDLHVEEELIEESVKEEAQSAVQKATGNEKTREAQAANDRADHAELMMSANNQPVIPKDDPILPKFIVVGVMKCGT